MRYITSLNSHWFQNDKPSKLNNRKHVHFDTYNAMQCCAMLCNAMLLVIEGTITFTHDKFSSCCKNKISPFAAMMGLGHSYVAMLSNQFSMEKQLLGLKLVKFCHFHSLYNHNNTYKAVEIAKETSSATPIPKKHKNKTIFVRTKIPLCIFCPLGILLV